MAYSVLFNMCLSDLRLHSFVYMHVCILWEKEMFVVPLAFCTVWVP